MRAVIVAVAFVLVACGARAVTPSTADASFCLPRLTSCDGRCVDLATDPSHCGSCGNVCPSMSGCNGGTCSGCPVAWSVCNGACVFTQTDPNHCGGCNNVCRHEDTCVNSTCTLSLMCPPPEAQCASGCADLRTDPRNCGACGHACALAETCSTGVCQQPCAMPFARCANGCTDTTEDVSNCGGCSAACGAGRVCSDGLCVASPAGRYRIEPSPATWIPVCENAVANHVLGGVDDGTMGPMLLPFAFTFYGISYRSFEASADGYVSFVGHAQSYYGDMPLPSPNVAHPAIYAYERDLYQRGLGVCTMSFGTAPNRTFVVETGDAYHFGDMTTHLTFEIVLSEGTNTIDLLYLSLSGTRTSGEMAVVGIEDATGTRATEYETNTAGTLHDGLAIRFTPM